jgi:hypothetical protein
MATRKKRASTTVADFKPGQKQYTATENANIAQDTANQNAIGHGAWWTDPTQGATNPWEDFKSAGGDLSLPGGYLGASLGIPGLGPIGNVIGGKAGYDAGMAVSPGEALSDPWGSLQKGARAAWDGNIAGAAFPGLNIPGLGLPDIGGLLDPNSGADAASAAQRAAGAAYAKLGTEAQQQYQGLGREAQGQWRQGGQTALGFTAPYGDYAQSMTRQGPGAFEQGSRGFQMELAQPLNQAGAYGNYQGFMAGEHAQNESNQRAQSFAAGPSAASGAYGSMQSAFSGPSNTQQTFGQAQGQLGKGGELASLSGQNLYGGLGRSETFQPGSVSAGQNYNAGAQQRLSGPTATQQNAGGVSSIYGQGLNAAQGARATEGFAGRQLPGMEQAGNYERFASDVLTGARDNGADLMKKRGMDAINQQLASRGHYNSGGGLAALGNYGAAFDAENFGNLANLAAGSQQAQMQRLGQAQGLAQASDQGALGRAGAMYAGGGALQGLAGQMDSSMLGREAARLGAAGLSSQEQFGNIGAQQNAAIAADTQRLNRLQGQTNLANMTDANAVSRWSTLGNIGAQADTALIGQQNALSGAARNQDMGDEERMRVGMDSAKNLDQFGLDMQRTGYDMAQGVDAETGRRISARAGLSQQEQQLQMARQQQNADNLYRMGGQAADIYGNYFGGGMGQWYDAQNRGIGAWAGGQDSMIGANLDASLGGARQQSQNSGTLLGLLGMGAGAFFGGPQGAMMGYGIGSSVGSGQGFNPASYLNFGQSQPVYQNQAPPTFGQQPAYDPRTGQRVLA